MFIITKLSQLSGVSEPAVRLLVSVLIGKPTNFKVLFYGSENLLIYVGFQNFLLIFFFSFFHSYGFSSCCSVFFDSAPENVEMCLNTHFHLLACDLIFNI